MEEIKHFLRQQTPFSQLSPTQVAHIAKSIKTETYGSGQNIFIYGSKPLAYLYIVRHGSVALLREDEQGTTLIDTLEEGDYFGHPSLIRRQPPIVTTRAHEDTELYLLPAAMFYQLSRSSTAFNQFFTTSAVERLGNAFQAQRVNTAHVLFQTRLGDLEQHNAICIAPETTVGEAARIMRDNYLSALVVSATPLGIITDRDLRSRVLAAGLTDMTPVADVMSSPALTMTTDRLVFEALMTMLKRRIHHIPITDNGTIVGVVTDTDIMQRQSRSPLLLIDQLQFAQSIDDFRAYTEQVAATVGALLDAGARVQDIGQVVAVAHDALLARLLQEAEEALGTPPCRYAWLVLGSEGRYEQTLRTDQDNALIYADDAPPEVEAYFVTLADRIVNQLVAVGFPPCPGNIMATNPEWRQPLAIWRNYFSRWIRLPEEEALLRVGIFFDYRKVYGELDVEATLRPIIEQGHKERVFLGRLARAALRRSPPIGFFRQFVVEQHGTTRDLIDLKERGTALIVDLARLFAIEAKIGATNTIERLKGAAGRSNLSESGAEDLMAAFDLLSLLRLRHQYRQLKRDEPMSNLVSLSRLSKLEQRELKEALRTISRIQRGVEASFQTTHMG